MSATHTICFVGGARYSQPLDATSEKKFSALSTLGEISVIGFSSDFRYRRFVQHARFFLLPIVPLPVLRYAMMFLIVPWLALRLIRKRGVRILIAQSPHEGFAAACAKRLAARQGIRVALVVESHGDFEQSIFLQRRVAWRSLYRVLMERTARVAFSECDVLRAVSRSTRAQLERWAAGKTVVQFPTWTDIRAFLAAGEAAAPPAPGLIVYAGVLTPLKGVHHVLDAFRRIAGEFPEAHLKLIGKAENEAYAAELREKVNAGEWRSRIHFTGAVSQRELAETMARASVVVLPSYSEGLPRVLLEAMASGCPVIATAVSGIPEIVSDTVNGFLIPPGDVDALAARLRWILTHTEEARQMGARGRQFVNTFFSQEKYVAGYRQVCELAEAARQSK